MLLLPSQSHLLSGEVSSYQNLAVELQSLAKPCQTGRLVERGQNLVEVARREDSLFILKQGMLTLVLGEKAIAQIEEGDVSGFEQYLPLKDIKLEGGFAVIVDQYKVSALAKPSWVSSALGLCTALYLRAYAVAAQASEPLTPSIKRYETGQVIVKQGELGDELFTLVEGAADALVDGVKIGEIMIDEVFGAIAALGGVPRTATIVATQPSLVLALTRERLIDLIKQKPQTVEKLILDLGRIIKDLNSKLVAQKNSGQ